LVSISTTLFRHLSILPIALQTFVNFGFFRFPSHFSSRWPCESSTKQDQFRPFWFRKLEV
jgi:hypothetical protein